LILDSADVYSIVTHWYTFFHHYADKVFFMHMSRLLHSEIHGTFMSELEPLDFQIMYILGRIGF